MDPAARRRLVTCLALAIVGGALNFLCVATFDIWPLGWIAQVPLLYVLLELDGTRPVLYGFVTGLVTNAGGFYWIVPFLQRFGHLPLVAAVPIFLLLVSYQAITFTLFAFLLTKLRDDKRPGGMVLLAPLLWVAIELVVPFIFPWYLAISQAWVRPAIQVAELTGPLGVSALLMLVNALIYEFLAALIKKRALPKRRLLVGGALVIVVFALSIWRMDDIEARRAEQPLLRVGLVQADIGLEQKWAPNLRQQNLLAHQTLSLDLEKRGADLIVWPESAYPFGFAHDQPHDWPEGNYPARHGLTKPLFFGTLTRQGRRGPVYNSAILLDDKSAVRGVFDKNILMVFGEYTPFADQMQWLVKLIPEISNMSRGTDVMTMPLEHDGRTWQLGPMICYEDIFPSFGRRLAKLQPNVLINITNDAWFGKTSEPYEHMALAVLRAVELRVDLVRAVNTGVSSHIDSTGRVVNETHSVDPDEDPNVPPTPETLLADVRLQTPSTLYATLGEWFGGLCMLLIAIIGVRARRAAGLGVRWHLVATGVALLVVVVAIGGVFFGGIGAMFSLLAHRITGLDDARNFTLGVRLFGIGAVAALALGYALARVARQAPEPRVAHFETALALLFVVVVPALLFGTLEGEQAGLVISYGLAIALARVGARFASRVAITPATSSSPPSPLPPRTRNRKSR